MVRSVRSDPIFRWTIENWFAGRTETETEGKKKKKRGSGRIQRADGFLERHQTDDSRA